MIENKKEEKKPAKGKENKASKSMWAVASENSFEPWWMKLNAF